MQVIASPFMSALATPDPSISRSETFISNVDKATAATSPRPILRSRVPSLGHRLAALLDALPSPRLILRSRVPSDLAEAC